MKYSKGKSKLGSSGPSPAAGARTGRNSQTQAAKQRRWPEDEVLGCPRGRRQWGNAWTGKSWRRSLKSMHKVLSTHGDFETTHARGRLPGQQHWKAEKSWVEISAAANCRKGSWKSESCQVTGPREHLEWKPREVFRSKDRVLGIRICHEAKGNTLTECKSKLPQVQGISPSFNCLLKQNLVLLRR